MIVYEIFYSPYNSLNDMYVLRFFYFYNLTRIPCLILSMSERKGIKIKQIKAGLKALKLGIWVHYK